MDISNLDAATDYVVQLAQFCNQAQSWNATLRISPIVYLHALRLGHTKVSVWTHESIGYPKLDTSHWDPALHGGLNLAQYCNQTRSCDAILQRFPPLYSLALSLKVYAWTHECIRYPKMNISHCDATIHYGAHLAHYCDQTRSCNAILQRFLALYSYTLRLREVYVWTQESMGVPKNGHQSLGRGTDFGAQLTQYFDQTRSWNGSLQR